MKRISIPFMALALILLFPITSAAQHPEHPAGPAPQRTPREPKIYSTTELEKAIKANVEKTAKKTNGVFKLEDKEMNKTWDLTLDKVHTDRLTRLSANEYFACVDMKDPDGKTIDVDFFMKPRMGKLSMYDVTVHKIEGKPRYNWEEKDGFWKRAPLSD